jgi:O-antigen ligase
VKGLILIYLITAFGSIGAVFAPVIGLATYVLFAVLRPQSIWAFAGDFNGISRWVGIATLIGWALHGFGSLKVGRGKSIVVLLMLFSGWTLLSATQAMDTDVAYATLEPMAKYIMPFFIGVTIIQTQFWSRTLLWVMVLAQGYVGYEMNLAYLRGWNIAAEGFGGMDNNCFGVALVSTIGPAMALMMGAKRWQEKALAAAAGALILHTTLLTFSRGALVGLMLVGLTAFIIMPKRPKYVAVLVLCLLVTVRLVGPQLAARYGTMLANEENRDESAESRLDLWADCWKVIQSKPLFGVGPGNFRVVAAELGWPPGKQAHTTWLQTGAENGAPAMLLLLLFFGTAVVKLWPIARSQITDENRVDVVMAAGIIMCVVGFIISGQFVSLGGLEIPYYATMIGVALLKQQQAVPIAARIPSAIAPTVNRGSGMRGMAPAGAGRIGR